VSRVIFQLSNRFKILFTKVLITDTYHQNFHIEKEILAEINADNIIYTPHVAWNSVEAEIELRKSAAQEVKRVLEGGKPLNIVNEEVL